MINDTIYNAAVPVYQYNDLLRNLEKIKPFLQKLHAFYLASKFLIKFSVILLF